MGSVFGGGDKPDAPDYTKIAKEQAELDKKNKLLQFAYSNPSMQNVFGSRTWSLRPGADQNNPQPGDWIVQDSLNAGEQSLYDKNLIQRLALADKTSGASGQNLLEAATALLGGGGNLPDLTGMNIPKTLEDINAQRKAAEDNYYQQATRFADERFSREEEALRSRLWNQGLDTSSEAASRDLTDFSRRKDEFYGDAASKAYMYGGEEASRTLRDLLAGVQANARIRSQLFGEDAAKIQSALQQYGFLSGSSQPNIPNFGGTAGMQSPQTPDLMGAATNQYSADVQAYNAEQARKSNLLNTAISLGTMAATGGMSGLFGGMGGASGTLGKVVTPLSISNGNSSVWDIGMANAWR